MLTLFFLLNHLFMLLINRFRSSRFFHISSNNEFAAFLLIRALDFWHYASPCCPTFEDLLQALPIDLKYLKLPFLFTHFASLTKFRLSSLHSPVNFVRFHYGHVLLNFPSQPALYEFEELLLHHQKSLHSWPHSCLAHVMAFQRYHNQIVHPIFFTFASLSLLLDFHLNPFGGIFFIISCNVLWLLSPSVVFEIRQLLFQQGYRVYQKRSRTYCRLAYLLIKKTYN